MENKPDYFHHIEHRKFQSSSKITLWLSLVITMIFTVVEFVGGIVSNSHALLSDSFHMLSDVLALDLFLEQATYKELYIWFFTLGNYRSFSQWLSTYCYFTRNYV